MRYLLPLFCFVVLGANAQITIDNTDMPAANDTFRYSIDNTITGINPALTGANYTWNFSSQLVAENQRVDEYVSVTSTPLAYQLFFNNNVLYPNHKASYALVGRDVNAGVVSIQKVFNYYKNSSTEYSWVGYGAEINSIPSSVRNLPVDINYSFPLNFGNTISGNSSNGLSVPGLGYYGQDITRNDTVDGWGSLTTPFGTFNCLRIKSTLDITDTIYTSILMQGIKLPRPTQVQYKWLAKGEGVPLLIINDIAGQLTAEYRDTYRAVPGVGVKEYTPFSEVTVYPNPSINNNLFININSDDRDNIEIRLLDFSGKQVLHQNVSLEKGLNTTQLAIEHLASGVYFVQLLNNNAVFVTEKVVVE
jgi:hypothetical protein